MRKITEKVLAKLKEISGIKSVELYAGQLDEPERYRSRMPGILLLFRENPLNTDYDYETRDQMRYSAILMYSNKRSAEEQILDSLDILELMMLKLKELRGMRMEAVNPVEFNKAFSCFEIQFMVVRK